MPRAKAGVRPLVGVLSLVVLTALVLGAVFLIRGDGDTEATAGGVVEPTTGPTIGAQAPDFKALDIDGNPVTLADYAGKPLWLLFQTTWCSICRAELPDVEAAAQDVAVVALYLREDRQLVADYAERMRLTIVNVPDPIGEISLRYLATSVPTHFFVDGDGVIQSIHKGGLSPAEIEEKLALVGVGV